MPCNSSCDSPCGCKHNRVIKGDLTVCGEIISKAIPVAISGSHSIAIPDGPYAVDMFQISVDNAQYRSPMKFLVANVANIVPIEQAKTVTVDGNVYYGELVDGNVVYLTYPTPITIEVFVPSTRTDKTTPINYFPDDTNNEFINLSNLRTAVAAEATSFATDGYGNRITPPILLNGDGDLTTRLSEVITNEKSLAADIRDLNLADWTGLIGKFLLDNLVNDAYDRLVAVQASLVSNINANARGAVVFMEKVMGSLGVPSSVISANSILQADRERTLNLFLNSNNLKQYREYKCYSRSFPPKQTSRSDSGSNIYDTQFDGTNINLVNGKVPVILGGDPVPITYGRSVAEKMASWGIAYAICNNTYIFDNIRVPGKTRTAEQIISDADSFPDYVNYYGTSSTDFFGSYSYLGDVAVQPGPPIAAGFGAYSWAWNFGVDQTTTGSTSYAVCLDEVTNIIDLLSKAKDVNDVPLSQYLNLGSIGAHGRSGGISYVCGANQYAKLYPNVIKAIFSDDCVYSFPFNKMGAYYTGLSDTGGDITKDLAFPDGANAPVLFLEADVDHFSTSFDFGYEGYGRYTVGPRKELQNLIRRTPLVVRNRCIYMEQSATGHSSSMTQKGTSSDGLYDRGLSLVNGTAHPSPPSVPNNFDLVFGFHDTFNVGNALRDANMQYSLRNTFALFFRMYLSPFERISAGLLTMAPFVTIIGPWDIPGADDYQWTRKWEMDLGGKYTMELNANNDLVISDDTDTGAKLKVKPTTLNIMNIPTSSLGLVSGDLYIDTGNSYVIKVVP